MEENEAQVYVDGMYQKRGYILDFHKILAAEDFDFLKAYNQSIEAGYTRQRALVAKDKELIYTVLLTSVKASVEQIKLHVTNALQSGASKTEVLEALELCIPAAGVPAFMIGFEAWKQVVSPDAIEPSSLQA
jgi:4-carboxymuconolactone decarboxylase